MVGDKRDSYYSGYCDVAITGHFLLVSIDMVKTIIESIVDQVLEELGLDDCEISDSENMAPSQSSVNTAATRWVRIVSTKRKNFTLEIPINTETEEPNGLKTEIERQIRDELAKSDKG